MANSKFFADWPVLISQGKLWCSLDSVSCFFSFSVAKFFFSAAIIALLQLDQTDLCYLATRRRRSAAS